MRWYFHNLVKEKDSNKKKERRKIHAFLYQIISVRILAIFSLRARIKEKDRERLVHRTSVRYRGVTLRV